MNFSKSTVLKEKNFHYCAGCGHSIIHRLVAEVIEELKIKEKVIATAPVGCAVLLYDYLDVDIIECAHGRIPAVATAMKRLKPKNIIITYQGDGDLAAIGTNEIIHAANRGENITAIFVNNAIYGMTGGQMAPTTLLNQKSTTSAKGRTKNEGYPIKVCELLSTLDGVKYAVRTSVSSPADVIKTKKAIKKAIENQMNNKGFSIVEILSMCPTCWKKTPQEAVEYIKTEMKDYFKEGTFKDE